MRDVVVTGIGTTKFDYYPTKPIYTIGTEAIVKALKDSGFLWGEIQAAYCGSVYQGTGSGHQVIREIGLTGIPIVNIENACSSGSSAFRLAYNAIALGEIDVAMVLGFEKMPKGAIPSTAFRPWQLELGFNFQPANYALETREYMEKFDLSPDDISAVTIKNRKHGTLNSYARFQKEVTLEEVNSSRMISSPCRLLHCAPIADGATCLILSSKNKSKNRSRDVTIASSVLVSSIYGEPFYQNGMLASLKYYPKTEFVERSANEAYGLSSIGPEDIDVIQAYDSMAPAELWDLEKLGFCKPGEAARLVKEGYFSIGGLKPSNTDGGLMSRGHPLGATGCSQIYEIVTQLRGEAQLRQVKDAKTGICHSMGAGPNSCVTILKK